MGIALAKRKTKYLYSWFKIQPNHQICTFLGFFHLLIFLFKKNIFLIPAPARLCRSSTARTDWHEKHSPHLGTCPCWHDDRQKNSKPWLILSSFSSNDGHTFTASMNVCASLPLEKRRANFWICKFKKSIVSSSDAKRKKKKNQSPKTRRMLRPKFHWNS